MKKMTKEQKNEKGQSMVEFAFMLVFIIILFSGVVDLGRMFFSYITLRDASEEGVSYGIIDPTNCSQIEDRVRSMLDDESIQVDVLIDGVACNLATATNACMGREINVSVANPQFPMTMPFVGSMIGSQTINLDASISGTIITPICQ